MSKQHFEKKETEISNTYLSAAGNNEVTLTGKKYNLFTQQYFIGLGVGFVSCYLLIEYLWARETKKR